MHWWRLEVLRLYLTSISSAINIFPQKAVLKYVDEIWRCNAHFICEKNISYIVNMSFRSSLEVFTFLLINKHLNPSRRGTNTLTSKGCSIYEVWAGKQTATKHFHRADWDSFLTYAPSIRPRSKNGSYCHIRNKQSSLKVPPRKKGVSIHSHQMSHK